MAVVDVFKSRLNVADQSSFVVVSRRLTTVSITLLTHMYTYSDT